MSFKVGFAIFLILHVILVTSLVTLVEGNKDCKNINFKCTSKDPRTIYPKCMLYSLDLSLWCDQSNYTTIPDPERILPYSSCTNASALYINDSCLRTIKPGDLSKYTSIREMKCGQNYIKKLQRGIFSANVKLEKLDFCQNAIDVIEAGTFQGLRNLEVLNLANNDLDNIVSKMFAGLVSLKEISFHKNRIQILHKHAFRRLTSLEVLTLTANKISHIDKDAFDGLERLTHLHLDENKISTIDVQTFSVLENLQVLTISYNQLLFWPDFSENSLANVHTLNLAHNLLEELRTSRIANLSKLQNLSLENNSLATLAEDLFRYNPNLRYLNVANNILEDIGKYVFANACYLETLVLRKNHLKNPRTEWFFHITGNDRADGNDVSGNPWKCDCDAMQYAMFVKKLDPAWRRAINVKCSSPKKYKDLFLDTLEESLGCDLPPVAEPKVPCHPSAPFMRVPEHMYVPSTQEIPTTTTSELIPESTNPLTTSANGIKEPITGNRDQSLLYVGVAAAVLFVLILCIMVLKRRIESKYPGENSPEASDDRKLPSLESNRCDVESGFYHEVRDDPETGQVEDSENDRLFPSGNSLGSSPISGETTSERINEYVSMTPQHPQGTTVPKSLITGGCDDRSVSRHSPYNNSRKQPDGQSVKGAD